MSITIPASRVGLSWVILFYRPRTAKSRSPFHMSTTHMFLVTSSGSLINGFLLWWSITTTWTGHADFGHSESGPMGIDNITSLIGNHVHRCLLQKHPSYSGSPIVFQQLVYRIRFVQNNVSLLFGRRDSIDAGRQRVHIAVFVPIITTRSA